MARIEKESKLKPEEVLKRAIAFFGTGGYGLELKENDSCSAFFEGGGGSVRVNAVACKKGSTVELESVEWDYQVKKFLEKL